MMPVLPGHRVCENPQYTAKMPAVEGEGVAESFGIKAFAGLRIEVDRR
jgi:hypothetical protein